MPKNFSEKLSTMARNATNIVNNTVDILEDSQNLYDNGFEAGVKSEYDKFWDRLQKNGTQTNYNAAFKGAYFGFTNFYPKYDIVPTIAPQIFYDWTSNDYEHRDSLKRRLEECGVKLDTSQATNMANAFSYSRVTELPTIDLSKATNTVNLFSHSWGTMHTIEKVIVSETTKIESSWFLNATGLKNIIFEGVIATSIDFSWCPLTVASMKSVISCLKNYSGTANEGAYTVTFTEGCWDALEADSASPSGGTWLDYVYNLGWLT